MNTHMLTPTQRSKATVIAESCYLFAFERSVGGRGSQHVCVHQPVTASAVGIFLGSYLKKHINPLHNCGRQRITK